MPENNSHLIKSVLSKIQHGWQNNLCSISKMHGSSRALVIYELSKHNEQIVVLLSTSREVQELSVELTLLGFGELVVEVTDYSINSLQEKLTYLGKRSNYIICATHQLLSINLPTKEAFNTNTTVIESGSTLSYDDLLDYLNILNYQKQQFVEERGDFAKRGAIIDFWSYSENLPVRIEFDGDFIESIRYFDPESQRSVEPAEKITLAAQVSTENTAQFSLDSIYDYLGNPLFIVDEESMKQSTSPTVVKDVPKIIPIKASIIDEDAEIPPDLDFSDEEVETKIEDESFDTYFNEVLILKENIRWIYQRVFAADVVNLELGSAPVINSHYKILFISIQDFISKGYRVYIAVENELQFNRYTDVFNDPSITLVNYLDEGKIKLIILPLKEGFVNTLDKVALFTDYQIFNKPYRTKLPSKVVKAQKKSKKLESIKPGDFIVHEEYGVGKFTRLEEISIGETTQESMRLLYNDGGIVYVNLNYLHLVKKFSAKEGITPTLATLGSLEWANKKKKAKKKIKEAARELIELYARRKLSSGYAFSPDSVWQQELEVSFIYEDTPDQSKVTSEVKADMEAASPMDRLVCGDVGFGKTEIAVRAAFKAVQDGKQVAILAPTTILVEQHFNTLRDRLSQFPVCVKALSRFQTKADQKIIVEEIKEGKVDIVIGTHRLLSNDVGFKDLGLLIIDEEHRFGVKSKEKLRSYKLNIDILTLTATPIPRTLNLSLLGARDLSIIATPPPNRQSIYTRVESFESAKIRDWVIAELKRSGQVYVVHDRIQSIEKFASYLKRQLPEVKIAVAHGQMKATQLEDVFHGFLHRKYDILLATKIIESGLDIPNVNTIIINRADRFGLAELHQLRGRVGRSDRQAYAYLLVPTLNALNKNSLRRLKAIEEYSDVGSGFNLSMRDLEIRGAGNLLGTEQTGFIDEIGFDLYIKLINESVEEIRSEEFSDIFKDFPTTEKKSDASIESYFEIGIPNAYISEQIDRLSYYTALYGINQIEELNEIREEMRDRFGALPSIVERLFKSAQLKYYASRAFFERIIIQRKQTIIVLPKGDNVEYYTTKFGKLAHHISDNYSKSIQLQHTATSIKLILKKEFEFPEVAIDFLTKFSQEVRDLLRK